MAGVIATIPKFQFSANGVPMVGGTLDTYIAGSTTPATTWQDSALTIANTNPISLDARGECVLWLDASVVYKFVLKNALGVIQWTQDNISNPAALANSLRADLAASSGASLVGFQRPVSGSQAVTVDMMLGAGPVNVLEFPNFTPGTGLSPTQRTNNGIAINAAISAAKILGSSVLLPPGQVEYDGTLLAANGVNVRGHGNMGEKTGGFNSTTLHYFGNTFALDMLGSGPGIDTRIQCCWSDFILRGTDAGVNAQAVRIGWNMRSMPLLANVTLLQFPHYGLNFADQNWNVSFDNLRIDMCGMTANNSSGIYKDPAVDGGTWNAITFNNLQVEGCGRSSSAAGGINIQTLTANRGLYFNNPVVEGNFGTTEIYITNMADLQFNQLYVERTNIAGQVNAVELLGCKGAFRGGYITGESAVNTLYGIKATNCDLEIGGGLSLATWGTAGILNDGSRIHTGLVNGGTFASSGNAQWFGSYAPRFSADSNGASQNTSSGVFTKVAFTARWDEVGTFDNANDRWVPGAIGKYQINASVAFVNAADVSQFILSIYKNGVRLRSRQYQTSGTLTQGVEISAQVEVTAATDYFEIFVRQTSGAARVISGDQTETWFDGAPA